MTFSRGRIARDALVIVGLLWFVIGFFVVGYQAIWFTDAIGYWSVRGGADPYAGSVLGNAQVFIYSPPLAAVFNVIGEIPLPAYLVTWTALNVAILAWLVRPWPWVALILAAPIADQIITGQIELLMTAAIVLSFRRPMLWILPLLAKPTTGVGLLWFLARRQWLAFLLAVAVTLVAVLVSVAVRPGWWAGWFDFLARTGASGQLLLLRIPAAAGIVLWGARTDRPWTVVAGAMMALPVIYIHSLAMLSGASYLAHQVPRSQELRLTFPRT